MLNLKFSRQYGGFVLTTLLPIGFLVIITLLTFAFERENFSDRVMVTLSALIVVAALFAQVASSLPNTSYTKCIDSVFISAIFFMSLIFVCHVIFASLVRRKMNIRDLKVRQLYKATPAVLLSKFSKITESLCEPRQLVFLLCSA
ncbi:hypothetical protein SK128_008953, partial [Halocaridina rubra]